MQNPPAELELKNKNLEKIKNKKNINWVKPEIVVEVKYLQITSDGELRAPVLLRIRSDKDPKECAID